MRSGCAWPFCWKRREAGRAAGFIAGLSLQQRFRSGEHVLCFDNLPGSAPQHTVKTNAAVLVAVLNKALTNLLLLPWDARCDEDFEERTQKPHTQRRLVPACMSEWNHIGFLDKRDGRNGPKRANNAPTPTVCLTHTKTCLTHLSRAMKAMSVGTMWRMARHGKGVRSG